MFWTWIFVFRVGLLFLSHSGNTYTSLHSLSSSLQNSNRAAVILPIFFFNHTSILQWCDSVEDCAALFVFPASLTSRSIHYQPETKAELIACLYTNNCFSNKRLVRTHVGHFPCIRVNPRSHPQGWTLLLRATLGNRLHSSS